MAVSNLSNITSNIVKNCGKILWIGTIIMYRVPAPIGKHNSRLFQLQEFNAFEPQSINTSYYKSSGYH